MRKFMVFLLIGLIAIFIVACGGSEDTTKEEQNEGMNDISSEESYEIQAAHVVSTETTQHEAFLKFQELVEEKSDGRITVDVYPDGQLGGEREMIEGTQAGDIHIASPSVGVLANFSNALEVFDFPFIFDDIETAREVLDGEFGQGLLDGLKENGLIGLNYGELGWRHLSNNKGEIVTPEDAQGLKVRTMEVPMHIEFWTEIGANPTPLAYTEVFTGLNQGVVDGVENVLGLIYSGKFHEVSKYITTTAHLYDPEIYIVNKEFFEGLPEADQEIIQTSMDEAVEYLRELNNELDIELRENLESEGAIFRDLSDDEKQEWLDAAVPFYEEFADEIDTEKLKQLLEAAGNEHFLDVIN